MGKKNIPWKSSTLGIKNINCFYLIPTKFPRGDKDSGQTRKTSLIISSMAVTALTNITGAPKHPYFQAIYMNGKTAPCVANNYIELGRYCN